MTPGASQEDGGREGNVELWGEEQGRAKKTDHEKVKPLERGGGGKWRASPSFLEAHARPHSFAGDFQSERTFP
jgi:hypothetical protein